MLFYSPVRIDDVLQFIMVLEREELIVVVSMIKLSVHHLVVG